MSKNTHGGKRSGAGRKKLPRGKKKQVIQIYESGETIKAVGGLGQAKAVASQAVNEAAKIS